MEKLPGGCFLGRRHCFNERLPPQPVVEDVPAAPFVDEEDMGSRSNKKPSRALRDEEGVLTYRTHSCTSFLHFLILLSDSHLLAALTGGVGAVGVTEGGGGLAGGPGRAGGPPGAAGGGGLAGGAAGAEAATAGAAPAAGEVLLAVASCDRSDQR